MMLFSCRSVPSCHATVKASSLSWYRRNCITIAHGGWPDFGASDRWAHCSSTPFGKLSAPRMFCSSFSTYLMGEPRILLVVLSSGGCISWSGFPCRPSSPSNPAQFVPSGRGARTSYPCCRLLVSSQWVFRVEFKSSILLVIALLPSLIAAITLAELYSRSVPSPCSDMAGSVALACLLAVVVAAPNCLLPVVFLVLDMYEDEKLTLRKSTQGNDRSKWYTWSRIRGRYNNDSLEQEKADSQ